MAAKFGFKITADDETKRDVKSAEKGLDNLGKAGEKAGRLLKAAFAGFTIAAITKGLNAVTDAFGEQETATLRLIAAAKNNPYINGDGVRNLKDYAAGLQEIGTFGDELIIQQGAILTSLQLSEDQIKGVLSAAVDLASTGMVSLEGAVRNISKTYSGMTGELGELIPQLRDLTAEELKAGGAVDLISEAYAGMAEAAAAGISGTKLQIKNMLGDLQEAIGTAVAPVFKGILEKLRPVIQSLIDWFTEHANQITNFFINFPEIAAAAFGLVKDIIARTFTFEFIANAFSSIVDYMGTQFRNVITFFGNIIAAIGVTIWEPLKTGFEWIAFGIRTAFRAVANALFTVFETIVIGPINAVISGLEAIVDAGKTAGAALTAFFKHPFSGERRTAAFQELISQKVPTDFGRINLRGPEFSPLDRPSLDVDAIAGAWDKAIKGVPAFAVDTWENIKNLAGDIGAGYSDLTDGFADDINDILSRELDDKVKSPILDLQDSLDDQGADGAPGGITLPDQWTGPTQGFSAGPTGLDTMLAEVGGALSGFGGDLIMAVAGLESIMAILDPGRVIIEAFINTIAGPLARALAPVIGIFTMIGNLLGNILVPIIDQLAPILEKLGEGFVWLHNKILKPIGNALIFVFTIIANVVKIFANAVIGIVNGVIALLNLIPGVNIGYVGYLQMADPLAAANIQDITYDQVVDSGGTGGGLTSGSGAKISGGNDITINFQINTDVLVGDRRELAEWIVDEIQDALELGEIVA